MQLGRAELDEPESLKRASIGRKGGGRKSAIETIEGIDAAFLKIFNVTDGKYWLEEMSIGLGIWSGEFKKIQDSGYGGMT